MRDRSNRSHGNDLPAWRGWRAELADWLTARRNLAEWYIGSLSPRVRRRREHLLDQLEWRCRRLP